METILKHHNQIELPQEVCRKMELIPGTRFEIEIDGSVGRIILVPITKNLMRLHSRRQHIRSRASTESHT